MSSIAPLAGVRMFYAALPDAPVRQRIANAAEALAPALAARWVPPDRYHLTIGFVGEVPLGALATLRSIGGAQQARAFSLHLDAYEYWPKPAVVVAAARAVPAVLHELWAGLHAALATHRWALDPKRLRPHVTLAKRFPEPAAVMPTMRPFSWDVSEFSLLRSECIDERAVYTVVDTWSLLDNGAPAADNGTTR